MISKHTKVSPEKNGLENIGKYHIGSHSLKKKQNFIDIQKQVKQLKNIIVSTIRRVELTSCLDTYSG